MKETENIALFDMDGTLCDYDSGLFESLEKLRSPTEPIFYPPILDDCPSYIRARADLIRSSENWWANLKKFKLGFDILGVSRELGFHEMILTKGPKRNPSSWSGKKIWIDRNLGEDTDITITRDKGLVYGKILVDDFPEYIKRWLEWRPRGIVIMPASKQNENFKHPQVTRYDGSNLEQVRKVMEKAKLRNNNL